MVRKRSQGSSKPKNGFKVLRMHSSGAANQSSAAMLRGVYEGSAVKGGIEVKKVQCEEISSVQWQPPSEVK